MAENRRPVRVPDGHYAVPDPGNPQRLTLWSVCAGVARDYPDSERWRPTPPDIDGESKEERQAVRQRWYETHYFPWRAAVAEAIERDPDGAAAAFVARTGLMLPLPTKPKRKPPALPAWARQRTRPESSAQRRRQENAALVLALRMVGQSVRQTGDLLGLSKSTVQRLSTDDSLPPPEDSSAVTAAVAMLRIEQLHDSLLVQRVAATGVEAERLDRYLADVVRMRHELLDALHDRGRGRGRG